MENEQPRFVVGVDFSPSSARAVDEAVRMARRMGARIDFVHICPLPPSAPELPLDVSGFDAAQKSLADLKAATLRAGVPAETHLGVGSATFGLLDFINRLSPSLVLVGSHGRTALLRALVGSVAENLIRRAPVPVLVVPAPHRLRPPADAAWSCGSCGHILGRAESTSRCAGCGAEPPHWIAAPLSHEPIDAGGPAVGEEERDEVPQRNDPAGLFATSPPGTDGCDVNPELRVRY
jgi:nucleotide-binding universal stress UspA family protein